ncbi:MAG: PD40 domain-containing protein [Chloroflexi bacterium]|nr:PD40 domain-containing protein [Chloroflexota bacterium]
MPRVRWLTPIFVLVAVLLALAGSDTGEPAVGDTTRVSVDSTGNEGNSNSIWPTISDDGRYVAFTSGAPLVAGDTNAAGDVFVHDRQTGTTERVSVSTSGTEGDLTSFKSYISGDGRHVAFTSLAGNLVTGDTNGVQDIFVHDRQTGETTRLSVSTGGQEGNGDSERPGMSDDGRYVVFDSAASTLVADDTNGTPDVFVHDRQTGTTTRVSLDSQGAQGDGRSTHSAISGDGRYVVFDSWTTNLVTGDTNGVGDVFVHDLQTGATERVSLDSSGNQANGESRYPPALNEDGRYVAFTSVANNLVTGDTNVEDDVFLRDRQEGTTTRLSVHTSGAQADDNSRRPTLAKDGRFVAFDSEATNLVSDGSNATMDVFVRDVLLGTTVRVSVDSQGGAPNSWSAYGFMSDDAEFVSFMSDASNLVPADTNNGWDAFVHELGLPCVPGTDLNDLDCDGVPNGSDDDMDGDGLDNDPEAACGSDPENAASVPERVDLGGDEDGDGQTDEPLPAGAEAFDCDRDGYAGTAEAVIFGGASDRDQDPCGTNGWPSDLNASSGPPDSLNRINVLDLTSFLAPVKYFGTDVGTNPGDVRWDLYPGKGPFLTDINIQDLTALLVGLRGFPPMLGGVRAFGGPVCPWAP